MKTNLITFAFLIGYSTLFGQSSKYFIGAEGGILQAINRDNKEWDKFDADIDFNAGIQFQNRLTNHLQFDIGFFYQEINCARINYDTDNIEIDNSWNDNNVSEYLDYSSLEIPLTLRYRLFTKNKFNLSPGLGIRFGKHYKSRLEVNYLDQEPLTYVYGKNDQLFSGATFSLGMSYQIAKNWKLKIDPTYVFRADRYSDLHYWTVNFGVYRSIFERKTTDNLFAITEKKMKKREKNPTINIALNRNAISFSTGYAVVIVNPKIGYENIFFERLSYLHQAAYAKVNIGAYISYDNYAYGSLLGGYLIGKNNKFLDVSLGALMMYDGYLLPAGEVAYRIQKNKFQFRTGLGFPSGAFIGVARTF